MDKYHEISPHCVDHMVRSRVLALLVACSSTAWSLALVLLIFLGASLGENKDRDSIVAVLVSSTCSSSAPFSSGPSFTQPQPDLLRFASLIGTGRPSERPRSRSRRTWVSSSLRTVSCSSRLGWWFMVWWSFRDGQPDCIINPGLLDAARATCWARDRRKAASASASKEL